MSVKISVISVSIAFLSLFFSSCNKNKDTTLWRVMEKSFSAEITVIGEDENEFCAKVTLSPIKLDEVSDKMQDYTEKTASPLRDGNVIFISPENIAGISAVRHSGVVTVNVCGIDLVVSDKVAGRYTYVIDMLDLREKDALRQETDVYNGEEVRIIYYGCGEDEYVLCVRVSDSVPLYVKGDGITVKFDSFQILD